MNSVQLIGRLVRDPETRYGQQSVVCMFSIAIDNGKDKNGNKLKADFPSIKVFGKQAENCDRYLSKGMQVGILGKIETGSYTNKRGETVYTTDVVASRVYFIDNSKKSRQNENQSPTNAYKQMGFQEVEEENIPFI